MMARDAKRIEPHRTLRMAADYDESTVERYIRPLFKGHQTSGH
jgi:hypothetical protein